MINMPKIATATSHRSSTSSTPSAAGGGSLKTSSWSIKDDDTLITARASGMNWNQIAPKHFPTKTANACRKRHERLMERRNAEEWDGVKLDVLARAYMDARQEMWSILASRVGEKWQLVEQKCMEKGFKNLSQAARAAHRREGNRDLDDSGISMPDVEDDVRHETMHDASGFNSHYPPAGYQSMRVPSIHSILEGGMPAYGQHP